MPAPTSETATDNKQWRTSQNLAHIFAEGVGQVGLGHAVCKIDLFKVIGANKDGEIREISHTLTMPTLAVVEFCKNTLSAIQDNVDALNKAADQHKAAIVKPYTGKTPVKTWSAANSEQKK
jgi:hypothetical protein